MFKTKKNMEKLYTVIFYDKSTLLKQFFVKASNNLEAISDAHEKLETNHQKWYTRVEITQLSDVDDIIND